MTSGVEPLFELQHQRATDGRWDGVFHLRRWGVLLEPTLRWEASAATRRPCCSSADRPGRCPARCRRPPAGVLRPAWATWRNWPKFWWTMRTRASLMNTPMAYNFATVEFVETPTFSPLGHGLVGDDEYRALPEPTAGRPFNATRGIPGLRFAAQGAAKRGGVRTIYYVAHGARAKSCW